MKNVATSILVLAALAALAAIPACAETIIGGDATTAPTSCVSGQRKALAGKVFASTGPALDDDDVYFGEQAGIPPDPSFWRLSRVPKQGGAPQMIESGSGMLGVIRADAQRVYWINFPAYGPATYDLLAVDKAGGTPVVLYSSDKEFGFSVDDPEEILVLTGSWMEDGELIAVPKAGGAPTILAANLPNSAGALMAVDDERVYWFREGADASLMSIPRAGGAPEELLALGQLWPSTRVVLDGDRIYWAASGPVSTGTVAHSTIYSMPKAGGPATALVSPGIMVGDLAVDDACLYWTGDTGTFEPETANPVGAVGAVRKTGGTAALIHQGTPKANSLEVDQSGLYLTAPAATQPTDWNTIFPPASMGAVDRVSR